MFKKFILILFTAFFSVTTNAADVSNIFNHLIPGEGLTEASIQINEDDEAEIEILALRDIQSKEKSNFFTQFSLHNQEINQTDRYIGNLGFGFRKLSDDKSNMYGLNLFYDNDFNANHQRGSIGLEAKGAYLDFTMNNYIALSNPTNFKNNKEEILSGYTINLASQVPYAPWAKLNLQSYVWDNVKASTDTKGYTLGLEAYLTPSLAVELKNDTSDNKAVDDEFTYKLTYVYPPRGDGKSIQDGFSKLAFEKQNMESKLSEKVQRDNNIVIEIQGSVIITSK